MSVSSSLPAPIRRRSQVTREGWAAIALTGWVLASSLMSRASLTLLVFCMLVAVLLIGGVRTVRNLRGLVVARRLPDQAVAGRPFHVEIDVHNGRWVESAQGIVISSPIQPDASAGTAAAFLPLIPPRRTETERIELTLPHRGRYRFGPLEVTSRFPFGFIEKSVIQGAAQELLVYPRLGKLSRRFFEVERETHPHQEGRRPGPAALAADYHGLREYRDGDSPRWIHWATSARRGRLMVREFEARHNRDVAVLLDPFLPAPSSPRDVELLELAISFVATMCVELCERHSLHLVLGIASQPPIVRHGQTSARLARELLEHLALVQGAPDTHWDALFQDLPLAWTSRMRITAVSPRSLDLSNRLPGAGNGRRWHAMARQLAVVDVGRDNLHDVFQWQ